MIYRHLQFNDAHNSDICNGTADICKRIADISN